MTPGHRDRHHIIIVGIPAIFLHRRGTAPTMIFLLNQAAVHHLRRRTMNRAKVIVQILRRIALNRDRI